MARQYSASEKPNRKWRICVDFTDLTKAYPKDQYRLPTIDSLVDTTSEHVVVSSLDTISRYHQILMALADAEKIIFITYEGVFCYKVMLFGLKNTGATY